MVDEYDSDDGVECVDAGTSGDTVNTVAVNSICD